MKVVDDEFSNEFDFSLGGAYTLPKEPYQSNGLPLGANG